MARTYAEMLDLIEQMLQDPNAAVYTTTNTNYWIEDGLKEFSMYAPHIVDVIFKIESRTGSDTAGTSGKLTDDTKSQFLATTSEADAILLGEDDKVVHNTTDNTWATVLISTNFTTSVMTLTANIMASGENYEIYHKRCRNNKQIYIGDMPVYLWIDSVEYPVGTRRNFTVYDDVVEIDVNTVADSDLTATILPDIDVLIRFAVPHVLSQLTHWEGTLSAATEAAGEPEIAIAGMGDTETIEVGEEFNIEFHRTLYFVRKEDTTSGNAVAALKIFPRLEAGTITGDVITFRKSSLQPQHEELFAHLVAARAVLSNNISYINAINKGGEGTWRKYQEWGERKLAEALHKLDGLKKIQTSRIYSKD